jgi:phosphoribosylformimino-5-aminoimidazole carboxamide ribotide isomerase
MALDLGMDRVVIGTAAVEDPQLVERIIATHGAARVVVGLDARDGMVAVSGWTETTNVSALDLMAEMHQAGVRRFLYTDIARDGTLSSPNFDALAEMVQRAAKLSPDTAIIASGGIADIEHLRQLTTVGVEAAIVGSAIYRGTVDLQQAVAELKGT